jgi:hypothetical protein
MDEHIDMYLRQLSQETQIPSYMNMKHPKMDRLQFHLLAEQQRAHREMLERRGKELMELEITGDSPRCVVHDSVFNSYKATRCDDGHHHNIHVHGVDLIVGKIYNLSIANHHHDGCYIITEQHGHEGLHAEVVAGPFDTCADC